MTPEELVLWRKAGKIAHEALVYGASLIKKGANMREVCDKIDKKVVELGAKPAWPAQIGNNEVAAHYTPEPDDTAVFNDEVVSLDVGAQVDGYVGDNACTVDLSGKHGTILKASEEALLAAEKLLAPGVKTGEIGKAIQDAILKHGVRPVKNLSGHGITRFVIHDDPSVPNIATKDSDVLKEGMIIAIEPFATNGKGMIHEQEQANIFSFVEKKPIRSPYAREALQFIEKEYGPFPFCTRQLAAKFGLGKANLALRDLLQSNILHPHAPLVEEPGSIVAVFENTFLITKDGCERLTK